ncbi:helix-turn-helix domain-containing protein [Parabacteroides bouchesdurhonensis]|uniref:helix-turn-helix domain-containing protein n=1 Tax=Parabacteroides bouchesdurhonensis TaxID=1936995 RepID=UPI000C8448EF|nr:helix-turn-helix domain-containing protein [Parabacteroides bouchesdurhonensis]
MTDGINTLRYSDIFLAMYFDDGKSCLHRNHSHVLVYMYSGEIVIEEKGETTRLHKGECAFIRKDFSVQMTKQAWNGEQFKAIFLMFSPKFLRSFYNRLDKNTLPKDAKRNKISLCKLPSNRPDIVSLFESMTPYFNSDIEPTEELLQLKMVEGMYVLLNTSKNLYASVFDFTDPWKIDILDFLESNYMNDISMEEIANYTGRSLSTFKRDFKKCSTLSPREWLIHRRLEAAHELIRKGERKVSEICFEVGFKNLSHFSKIYKERYGISPKGYLQHETGLA